ncbi:hypothetical protein BDF22DRAFT_743215 [Syncephalis plumigaleata]|nr:hypothetical protein BDF22DRAFT_743215 [Syncephalis plumigaleata]
MTFGIKTTTVAVIATLMLASGIFDPVEATPINEVQVPAVPGLVLTVTRSKPGDTQYGTYTTPAGVKNVKVKCFNLEREQKAYKQAMSTEFTNTQFYLSCARHKPTLAEAPLMSTIGCPLASYPNEQKNTCFVTETSIGKSSITAVSVHEKIPKTQGLRADILSKIIRAHKLAFDMGWYLTWNYNKYFVDDVNAEDLHLFINSEFYRMDRGFNLNPPNKEGTTTPTKAQKIGGHMYYADQFFDAFFSIHKLPEDNPVMLKQGSLALLPPMPPQSPTL